MDDHEDDPVVPVAPVTANSQVVSLIISQQARRIDQLEHEVAKLRTIVTSEHNGAGYPAEPADAAEANDAADAAGAAGSESAARSAGAVEVAEPSRFTGLTASA